MTMLMIRLLLSVPITMKIATMTTIRVVINTNMKINLGYLKTKYLKSQISILLKLDAL